MSRSVQQRPTVRLTNVYHCDRCGTEMKACDSVGITRPGEGAELSAREHQPHGHPAWLPLAKLKDDDFNPEYEAANVDLCPSCLASMLVWFAGGGDEMSVEVTHSERGFAQLDPVTDTYGGQVRVYESSSAGQPCVWIAIAQTEAVGEATEAHSHLTFDQLRAVRDRIEWMLANHYQLGGGDET